MESSGSLSESQPVRAEQRRNWVRWVRTAGVQALKGACTALGAGAISLLVWWIENR
ncbi:hypothetical protein ACIP96_09195 [Streptomyces nigra]|uniref:hypothetical protein n=1 Tax=Streptomyces nigra TaxID=1827580 RepID=UPI0038060868